MIQAIINIVISKTFKFKNIIHINKRDCSNSYLYFTVEKILEYLETKQKIQESFLDFLDNETNIEENFQNLTTLLNDQNIRDNKQELRLFFSFLMVISNNHHRGNYFFSKIERILQLFTKDIQSNYSNTEIFDIFKSNKLILLFIMKN